MDQEVKQLRKGVFFGKRYYLASDVEALLAKTNTQMDNTWLQIEKLAQQIEAYKTKPNAADSVLELREENNRLREMLDAQAQNAEKAPCSKDDDENYAEAERTRLTEERDYYQEKCDHTAAEINELNQIITGLRREILKHEQTISMRRGESMTENAENIVSLAVRESEKMMSEATKLRDGVVAASRAAYYNALQFKINLSHCVSATERDLDDAIEALRMLKISSGGSEDDAIVIATPDEIAE